MSGRISRVKEEQAGGRARPGSVAVPKGERAGVPPASGPAALPGQEPPAPAQLEAKGRPGTCGFEALTLRCPVLPYRETPDSCFGALLFPFRYWCLTSKWIFKHAVA